MKKLRKLIWNRKINKVIKAIDIEREKLVKFYKMVSFRITDGTVSELQANAMSAYLGGSKRCYISKVPLITVEALVKELILLSYHTTAIQLEFDEYNGETNIEIELYDIIPEKHVHKIFEKQNLPCSIALSKNFYVEFIDRLREKVF